ncbi:hypothetical protein [Microcoleus anatoxicus]
MESPSSLMLQSLRQVYRSQIPVLPDRIIAATGLYLILPVISRDRLQ